MKPRHASSRQRHTIHEANSPQAAPPKNAVSTDAESSPAARRELIAVEAYLLAERRGFTPGAELDDWLAAEAIVDGRLHEAGSAG